MRWLPIEVVIELNRTLVAISLIEHRSTEDDFALALRPFVMPRP